MPPHPPRSPRTPRRTGNPYARPRTPRTPRTPNTATRGLSLTCPRSPKRKRPAAHSPSPRRGVIDFAAADPDRSRRKSTGDLTPQLKKRRTSGAAQDVFGGDEDGQEKDAEEAMESREERRVKEPRMDDEEDGEDSAVPSSSGLRTPAPPGAGEPAVPEPLTPMPPSSVPKRTPRRSPGPPPSSTRVLRSSRALSLLSTLEAQVAGLKGRLLASAAENAALAARAAQADALAAELERERARADRTDELEAALAAEKARADEAEAEMAGVQRDHDVLARRVLALEAGYVCKCQGDVQGMKLDLARILAASAKERWSERSERRAALGSPDSDAAAE